MYIKRNNEARRSKHCCCGKAISNIYYECVFVALHIQHAMRKHHVVICDLSGSPIFYNVILQTAIFYKKKLLNIKYVF